jgi:NTE family protein
MVEDTTIAPLSSDVTGVFAGGGMRGIALAGAAAGALRMGYRFTRVIGTSAGAMVGSLLAAGYRAGELAGGIGTVPWHEFAEPNLGGRAPLIGRHLSVVVGRALYRGDRLEEVWAELLARKGVVTFGDLPQHSLRVVATDITHQRGVVLPDDLPGYGHDPRDFPVARAVRMSAAVPFVFRPVPVRDPRDRHKSLLVDGALAANFPLRLVESNGRPVIGFRLVPEPGVQVHVEVRGAASLTRAVVGAAIRAADSLPSPLLRQATLVDIPVAGDPLDFGIDAEHRRALYEAGRGATRRCLAPASPCNASRLMEAAGAFRVAIRR